MWRPLQDGQTPRPLQEKVAAPALVEAVLPSVPVKDLGDRVHERYVFMFGREKIQDNFATEIGANAAILWNAYDCLFSIDGWIKCFANVDVEPTFDLFLLWRDGRDDLSSQGDLIKRCHSLLSVEQQRLRIDLLRLVWRSFDRARLEVDRAPGIERHQSADWKCPGHGGDQALNSILVPHPTPLKVRQLKRASVAVFQEFIQIVWICLECRSGHVY